MKRFAILIAVVLLLVVLAVGCSQKQTTPKGTDISGKTDNGDKITVDQLAKIVPGAGVLMVEIGYRWWALYYAGIDGNWDLASYQIDETEEAMDVISVTRPKRKEGLKGFLNAHKKPLQDAIKAKDTAKFKTAFDNSVKGCNSCHKASEKGFVKWQIPTEKPPYLQTKP